MAADELMTPADSVVISKIKKDKIKKSLKYKSNLCDLRIVSDHV